MATASIGKIVKLNDEMADAMIEALKKPYKKVEIEKSFTNAKADSDLIAKLKKM